jgi:hypothetical protein
MSNLESAKAAIEAELSHAKEGLAFYHSRIEALEKMLSQLANVAGLKSASPAQGKRIKKIAVGKRTKIVKGKRAARESGGANELPFTGGTYWTDLISERPQSVSEILDTAVGKLGFSPTKEQIKKLAGRMTFALNALVKTKQIQDSGSGRDRRFFKK